MVVCFGISWPISIAKALRSRTSKGKSIVFTLLIFTGYIFGIASKLAAGTITYVFVFYVINLIAVGIDTCLWLRNNRLDKKRESENPQ